MKKNQTLAPAYQHLVAYVTSVLLFCCTVWCSGRSWATEPTSAKPIAANGQGFLCNKGQFTNATGQPGADVLFLLKSPAMKVVVSKTGLSYQFEQRQNAPSKHERTEVNEWLPQPLQTVIHRVDVRMLGSNPQPSFSTRDSLGYYENYYLPHCPYGITQVQAVRQVTLHEVYPGIDWVLYALPTGMKYEFVVRPGADPNQIQLHFAGADSLFLSRDGSLNIQTPLGRLTEQAPVSWAGAARMPVASKFRLQNNRLSFDLGAFSPTDTLTIDPFLLWGSYFGGQAADQAEDIQINAQNELLVTGWARSDANIATTGTHQAVFSGEVDAFLAKFDEDGNRLWTTYYGGSAFDWGSALALNAAGDIFLLGYTRSLNVIATPGTHKTIPDSTDAFLVRFNPSGTRVWGTYYGGEATEIGRSVTVDNTGAIYIAGSTRSFAGIATNGVTFNTRLDTLESDAFLARFGSNGQLNWGTYFGGYSLDVATSCLATPDAVFLAGNTQSRDSIHHRGHQHRIGGDQDAFLARFNRNNGRRVWATYYGGPRFDSGNDIALEPGTNNLYLWGRTESNTNIATPGSYQEAVGGNVVYGDAYFAKFTPDGTRLWGSYYGGPFFERGDALAVDSKGNVFLCGHTQSRANIATPGTHQQTLTGLLNVFVAKMDSAGRRFWGTYYGGDQVDVVSAAATDSWGNLFVVGVTNSSTGIATMGAHQTTLSGVLDDAFLAKFDSISCLPIFDTLTVSACESYTLDGVTYFASGNYQQIVQNELGCDVFTTLQLTILEPTSGAISQTACYEVALNGARYTQSGIYTQNLTNAAGCDSTLTVTVTILEASTGSLDSTACNALTLNGETFRTSGQYAQQFVNAAGCDSTLLINLTIIPPATDTLRGEACDSLRFFDELYTETGTYFQTRTAPDGCITNYTIQVTIYRVEASMLDVPAATAEAYPYDTLVVFVPTQIAPDLAYTWRWNDTLISTESSLTRRLSSAGSQLLELYIASPAGCFGERLFTLNTLPAPFLFVPNAFTPNNDDLNDKFELTGVYPQNLTLEVYDRWGRLLHKGTGTNHAWDGRCNGRALPEGNYMYVVWFVDQLGRKVVRRGAVLLLR